MEDKQFSQIEIEHLSNDDLYKEIQLAQEELENMQSKFRPYLVENVWCEFEEVAQFNCYVDKLQSEWIMRDHAREAKQFRNSSLSLN